MESNFGHRFIENSNEHTLPVDVAASLRYVWKLNDHEQSFLNRYFLLIRTATQFSIDNKSAAYRFYDGKHWLKNGGIEYEVIWQAGAGPHNFSYNRLFVGSFRYHHRSQTAVVLIKPKGEVRDE